MLIGTAVVGATTMVFGIIMLLENMFGGVVTKLSIVQPEIILGLIMGGSVIYWFTGASCQAVVTGAYRAVVYIKENMKLDATTASEKDSKEVVASAPCTRRRACGTSSSWSSASRSACRSSIRISSSAT